jgi:hypothetical protein
MASVVVGQPLGHEPVEVGVPYGLAGERSPDRGERQSLTAPAAPSFVRQRTAVRSLCDGWDEMDADQCRRILASVFETINVGPDGVKELTPHEGWRPYVRAAIRTARTLPQRQR